MPLALAQATQGIDDKAVRLPPNELETAVAQRPAYYLKTKQGPDSHGTIRLHCPAAGPSLSVNCARREKIRPRGSKQFDMPPLEGPERTLDWGERSRHLK